MNKVFVFSGTSEGREIIEFLCKNKIYNEGFVATEYGETVMEESKYLTIRRGRLTKDEMTALFLKSKPELIIDATHPHAEIVSENIKEACKEADIYSKYIRVLRNMESSTELEERYKGTVKVFNTFDAVKEELSSLQGNILLTTGIKELKHFMEESLVNRLYARILPSIDSINEAINLNFPLRQLILMEGPFKQEMNEATINQYDIKALVTKNSGRRGGITEKIEACKNAGCYCYIIDNIKGESGLSVDNAKRYLVKKLNISKKKSFNIVGIGMGNDASVTVTGLKVIKESEILTGAKRMTEYGRRHNKKAEIIPEYNASKILELIDGTDKQVTVLVSGDTGLYSLCNSLISDKYEVSVYPGISSMSYLSGKCGIPYSDFKIMSFHGKSMDEADYVLEDDRVFLVFSNAADVNKTISINKDYCGYIGENLGSEDEKVFRFSGGVNIDFFDDGLYCGFFVKEQI